MNITEKIIEEIGSFDGIAVIDGKKRSIIRSS